MSYVNSALTTGQGSGITLAGITVGHFLIAFCHAANSSGANTIHSSLNGAGNWTRIINNNFAPAGSDWMHCWICPNSLAGSETISCTGGGVSLQVAIAEYSQVPTSSALDTSNFGNGSSVSVTTSQADILIMGIADYARIAANPAQSGSYTSRIAGDGNYGGTWRGLGIFDTTTGSSGTFSNGSAGGASVSGVMLVAVKFTGGGGAVVQPQIFVMM